MKVLFFGHRAIALQALERLEANGINLVGVVAHPVSFDPKEKKWYEGAQAVCQRTGARYLEVRKTSDPEFLQAVRDLAPDLGVVVGFLGILKAPVLDLHRLGVVNSHGALLPRYRGRAPLCWALMNDELEVGLTVHFVDEGIDSGDIVLQKRRPITDRETAGTLLRWVIEEIPDALMEVIRLIQEGKVERTKQDDSQSTYFPLLTASDCRINWSQPSRTIFNKIRALDRPFPGAHTVLQTKDGGAKKIYIWSAETTCFPACTGVPGHVIKVIPGEGCLVKTGDSAILVKRVQFEDEEEADAWVLLRRVGMRLGLDLADEVVRLRNRVSELERSLNSEDS